MFYNYFSPSFDTCLGLGKPTYKVLIFYIARLGPVCYTNTQGFQLPIMAIYCKTLSLSILGFLFYERGKENNDIQIFEYFMNINFPST